MPVFDLWPFRKSTRMQPAPSAGNTPPIYSPRGAMTSPRENMLGPNVVADIGGGAIENLVIPAMYSAWSQWGYQPSMPWYQLVNQYTGWVQSVIDKKARSVAMMPLRVYQYVNTDGKSFRPGGIKRRLKGLKTGEGARWLAKSGLRRIELFDHPVLDLFDHPNPVQVYFSFLHKLETIFSLDGAVGIYKVKDAFGVPSRLLLLPQTWSGQFKAMPDVSGGDIIGGYRYQDGDLKQYFTPEEIVWIHLESLKSPFEGMSPIKSQMYSVNLDGAALNQQASFFANNAFPGLALKPGHELSDQQKSEIKASLQSRAGTRNTGKGMLLPWDIEPVSIAAHTSRDTMIDVVYKEVRDRIASSYDVSAGKMGLVDSQNRVNLDTVNENFIAEAIRPDCTLITQFLNQFLMPDFDDVTELDFEMPQFAERAQDLTEEQSRLDRGQLTINEWRTENDLDAVPWGEKPWLPMNLTQPQAGSPAVAAPDNPDGGSKEAADTAMPATSQHPPEPPAPDADPAVPDVRTALWRSIDALRAGCEPMFRKAVAAHFGAQKERVVASLERHGAKVKGDIANTATKDLPAWFARHKDVFAAINIKADGANLHAILRPAWSETMEAAAKARLGGMQDAPAFETTHPAITSWVASRIDMCRRVDETTRSDVDAALKAGYEAGKPLHEIAGDVRACFESAEKTRVHGIAATEAAVAVNKGDIESMRQMGGNDRVLKGWLCGPGARDTHAKAAKDYVSGIPLHEPFRVGADAMDAPGHGHLPEENCGCRCALIYMEKTDE